VTIGPNGWNEYSRLVLKELEANSKDIQAVREGCARQNEDMAVAKTERARQQKDIDKNSEAIEHLGGKMADIQRELDKRSVLVSLVTALITSAAVAILMRMIAGGAP